MATRDQTVTVVSPTPPTNIPCHGGSPPTPGALTAEEVAAPADPDDWADKTLFAAAVSGDEPEGAGTEEVVVVEDAYGEETGVVTISCLGDYTSTPNQDHPSSPDYVPPGP